MAEHSTFIPRARTDRGLITRSQQNSILRNVRVLCEMGRTVTKEAGSRPLDRLKLAQEWCSFLQEFRLCYRDLNSIPLYARQQIPAHDIRWIKELCDQGEEAEATLRSLMAELLAFSPSEYRGNKGHSSRVAEALAQVQDLYDQPKLNPNQLQSAFKQLKKAALKKRYTPQRQVVTKPPPPEPPTVDEAALERTRKHARTGRWGELPPNSRVSVGEVNGRYRRFRN